MPLIIQDDLSLTSKYMPQNLCLPPCHGALALPWCLGIVMSLTQCLGPLSWCEIEAGPWIQALMVLGTGNDVLEAQQAHSLTHSKPEGFGHKASPQCLAALLPV